MWLNLRCLWVLPQAQEAQQVQQLQRPQQTLLVVLQVRFHTRQVLEQHHLLLTERLVKS
jgi:hypothetical protein